MINIFKNAIIAGIADPTARWVLGFTIVMIKLFMLGLVFVLLYAVSEAYGSRMIQIFAMLILLVLTAIFAFILAEMREKIIRHIDAYKGDENRIQEVRFCHRWKPAINIFGAFFIIYGVLSFVFAVALLFIDYHNIIKIMPELINKNIDDKRDILPIICLILSVVISMFGLILYWMRIYLKRIVNSLKQRAMFIFFASIGAVVAILGPYISVAIQHGEFSSIENPVVTIMLLIICIVTISVISPPKHTIIYKDDSGNEVIGNRMLSFIVSGMAVPALVVSFLHGANSHYVGPEAEKINMKAQEIKAFGDSSSLKKEIGDSAPPIFFNLAYADKDSNQTLGDILNARGKILNTVGDTIFFESKKYVISLVKFSNFTQAIAFRDNCMKNKHSVPNSQVIQLAENNYRVIFPAMNALITRSDAVNNMKIIETNIENKKECTGLDPSILEFN